MKEINAWIAQLAHNYLLLIAAAVLFFIGKSIIGYRMYRQFRNEIAEIKRLIKRQSQDGHEGIRLSKRLNRRR